jgi:hypothetical protein
MGISQSAHVHARARAISSPGAFIAALALVSFGLAGCDKLGMGSSQQHAGKDAEGRAIGGACRHAGRAIEDCFALNRQADKAAVFAGWREMNDYMTKHKVPVATGAAVARNPAGVGDDGGRAEAGARPASHSGN